MTRTLSIKNQTVKLWDLYYMGYVTASPNTAELIDVFFASVLSNKMSQASLLRKKSSRVRTNSRK